MIGLFGYVFVPTAPPRLLGVGFVDTHRDGLVNLAANPYAAMPSLHAADALIVGVVLFTVCRNAGGPRPLWALWPAWVCFAVMATGNHFWLDCLAGIGVAILSMARRLQRAHSPRVCRSSGVTDRLPTRAKASARRVVRSSP